MSMYIGWWTTVRIGLLLFARIGIEQPDSSDEYEDMLQQLKMLAKKNQFHSSQVKKLMRLSFSHRRQWIKDDCPSVPEILKKFECLKTSSRVICACMFFCTEICMHACSLV